MIVSEPIFVANCKFGKGVFAKRDIRNGELICVMRGAKMTSKDFSRVSAKGRDLTVDPLQIEKDLYLDLEKPYVFFNHSCSPNSGLKNQVELFAIEDIKKGDQIFFDYSTTWFDGVECDCGNKNCRKHIGDYFSIPKKQRDHYRKLGIIPNFIKE